MEYFSVCFCTIGLLLSVSDKTVQQEIICSVQFQCDILNHTSENIWLKTLSEHLTSKRKSLNILLRKTYEFSLSVPDIFNKTDYLESLPNRFALVHRMVKVWPLLGTLLSTNFDYSIRKLYTVLIRSDEIYNSALRSLVRLQETYDLPTEKLARGGLEGAYPYTSMPLASIMDVAVYYKRLGHPWRAKEWLLEALEKTDSDNSICRKNVLEYLHIVNCYVDDFKSSAAIFAQLLQEYPSFTVNSELQDDYSLIANSSCSEISRRLSNGFLNDATAPHFIHNQASLCEPALYKPPSFLDPRLRCRLVHYNKPHLMLAPFKVEEMNLDPPVLIFYDVLHDGEIETIKCEFYNKTRPAVNDYVSKTHKYFDTQYTTWLVNKTDPITRLLDYRAASAANADLYHSEKPMLASYGVGAEIKMHEDLIPDERFLFSDGRTRPDYISFLFYMNDVPEGGYTIFPQLDLAVIPVKGAALMWHNRLPDLSRDSRIAHSGCPVLRGSKWIINKWFHVREQHYPKCHPGGERSRMYYYLPDCL